MKISSFIKINCSINILKDFLWQILFFLMLFFTREAQVIKLGVLCLLSLLLIIDLFKTGRLLINRKTRTFIIIFLSYSIISGSIGLLRGNPGSIGFIRVNVVYYFLLALLISQIRSLYSYEKIIKVIFFTSIMISIYSILLLFVQIGLWPDKYFIFLDINANLGIHEGYVHIVTTNLSMMIFILPFSMILYFKNYQFKNISKKYLLLTVVLAIVVVIFSGRRILWFSLFLPTLFIIFEFNSRKLTKNITTLAFIGGGLLLIFSFLNIEPIISIEGIYNRFLSAFAGPGENVRLLQAKALWDGFLENPILGSGAGEGASFIRSTTKTWSYELSYNKILFNSGIVGIILYFSSFCYLSFNLWIRKKQGDVLAYSLLVSFVTSVIANATNPYISSSFDFLWFVFFPLMYFNISYKELKNNDY
jgi:hypothetical protein